MKVTGLDDDATHKKAVNLKPLAVSQLTMAKSQ